MARQRRTEPARGGQSRAAAFCAKGAFASGEGAVNPEICMKFMY